MSTPTAAGERSQIAVVTGAARGLGQAIAVALSAAGYTVLRTDVASPAEPAATPPATSDQAGWFANLDVRDERACRQIAEQAAARGELALWVNNAGVLATGPSWTHDEATRRHIMDVNTLGTMNGTLAALETMRETGRGHIINVVSLAGLVAVPGEAVYAASKHAVLAFSIATRAELIAAGTRGIHISCLCPDGIWTPMLYDQLDNPAAAASFTGVLLRPEAVAKQVVALTRRPRPVRAVPGWRGVQVRLFDAFPRLALSLAGVIMATGRRGQRRQARRIGRASR